MGGTRIRFRLDLHLSRNPKIILIFSVWAQSAMMPRICPMATKLAWWPSVCQTLDQYFTINTVRPFIWPSSNLYLMIKSQSTSNNLSWLSTEWRHKNRKLVNNFTDVIKVQNWLMISLFRYCDVNNWQFRDLWLKWRHKLLLPKYHIF